MSSTEQVFSVTEFLDDLATTNNVAIATAATAIIGDNGTVFITVLGQSPKFTKKMDKGIINTNQCISFTDPTSKLICFANNVLLPLCMQGTN